MKDHHASVEDRVFGYRHTPVRGGGGAKGASTYEDYYDDAYDGGGDDGGHHIIATCVTDHMVPIVATLVLMAIVGWSLNNGIEYSEVFLNSNRHRVAIIACNAVAIALTITILLWHQKPNE